MKSFPLYLSNEQREILEQGAKEKGLSLSKYIISLLFPKDDKKEIENAILLKNTIDKQINVIVAMRVELEERLFKMYETERETVQLNKSLLERLVDYDQSLTDEECDIKVSEYKQKAKNMGTAEAKQLFHKV